MEDIYSGRDAVQDEVCIVPEGEGIAAPAKQEESSALVADTAAQEVVGFGAFLGLVVLFAIPVVGWIACALMAFLPKRKSLKNYARATLVWLAIGIIIVASLVSLISRSAASLVNSALNTDFGSIGEMIDLAKDIKAGDYSSLCVQMANFVPETYQPLVKELGSGKYTELFEQVKAENYGEILTDLESGKYADLVSKVDDDTYNKLKSGLEEAKDGAPPEALETIKEIADMDAGDLLTKLPDIMQKFGK